MKEYIRTTHNFNNETREWEYRGDPGGDKYEEWKNIDGGCPRPKWSFGVHALKSDQWMNMRWIIEETIAGFLRHGSDNTVEFERLMDEHPDFRKVIKQHILEELEYLVEMGMVKEREASDRMSSSASEYLDN